MVEKENSSAAFGQSASNGWNAASLLGMNQRVFESWTRGMSALGEELGEFVQARLQQDMGMWSKFASCRDMTQAFEFQRQYAQKAVSDYLDEAGKLTRLTVNVAGESMPKLWSAHSQEAATG